MIETSGPPILRRYQYRVRKVETAINATLQALQQTGLFGGDKVVWMRDAAFCAGGNALKAKASKEAAARFAGQIDVIGVTWSGSDDSYQAFIDTHGLTFPQLQDDAGEVFSRFQIAFQPALVIVKADGSTETIAGAVDAALLDQILAESI